MMNMNSTTHDPKLTAIASLKNRKGDITEFEKQVIQLLKPLHPIAQIMLIENLKKMIYDPQTEIKLLSGIPERCIETIKGNIKSAKIYLNIKDQEIIKTYK